VDHDEAIKRSIPSPQELENKLTLPLTSAAPSRSPLSARQNKLPNNPQETHGAPPTETPQQTNLTHRSRSH
jgi:hypothetical protein